MWGVRGEGEAVWESETEGKGQLQKPQGENKSYGNVLKKNVMSIGKITRSKDKMPEKNTVNIKTY